MSAHLDKDLVAALKRLRLGQLAHTLPDRIALARENDTPFDELLLMLLTDEIARRDGSAATRRAEIADLDPDMVNERWDKTAKVQFDRRVYAELCTLRFLEAHRNVAVLGPVGVGKTFLATALGHLACRSAFSVRFIRADELLSELRKSRLDNSREAVMTALCTVDLLIIDDFAVDALTPCVREVVPPVRPAKRRTGSRPEGAIVSTTCSQRIAKTSSGSSCNARSDRIRFRSRSSPTTRVSTST